MYFIILSSVPWTVLYVEQNVNFCGNHPHIFKIEKKHSKLSKNEQKTVLHPGWNGRRKFSFTVLQGYESRVKISAQFASSAQSENFPLRSFAYIFAGDPRNACKPAVCKNSAQGKEKRKEDQECTAPKEAEKEFPLFGISQFFHFSPGGKHWGKIYRSQNEENLNYKAVAAGSVHTVGS